MNNNKDEKDNSKISIMGFHILATQKNNICYPGGSQSIPGGPFGSF